MDIDNIYSQPMVNKDMDILSVAQLPLPFDPPGFKLSRETRTTTNTLFAPPLLILYLIYIQK